MVTLDRIGFGFGTKMPEERRLLISAFAAAYGVGWLSLLGLPFLVGSAMTSLHLDEGQAGLLVTVEFVGIMTATLGAAPFMGRFDRRKLAWIGALIALTANTLSIVLASYDALIVIRPLAGLGAGLAIACGNASVSNSRDPERLTGQIAMLSILMMVIILLLFSRLSSLWGIAGVYGGIIAFILLMLPAIQILPRHPNMLEAGEEAPSQALGKAVYLIGCLVVGAFFVFSLRDTMTWAFLERIGVGVGYTSEQIGNLIAIQALIGLAGPYIASVMGSRFGIARPLAIGIVLSGLVTYAISQSSGSITLFTVATTFQPGTYFFTLAYLTALAAELDPKGRIVAASGGGLMAGVAIGPVAGGALIVAASGYTFVSWAIIACMFATLLLTIVPLMLRKSYLAKHLER